MTRLAVLLEPARRREAIAVVVAMFIAAILELIGIGAIPAFVALLVEPERLLHDLPGSVRPEMLAPSNVPRMVLYCSAALTTFFILKNIYLTGLNYYENRFIEGVRGRTGVRLLHAYMCAPFTFHLQRNSAELVANVVNEVGHAAEYLGSGIRLLREGLVLVLVFLLLFWTDPVVSMAVFAVLGVATAVFGFALRSALNRRGEAGRVHWARQVQLVGQVFGSIKETKILGTEGFLLRAVDCEIDALRRNAIFYNVVTGLPRLLLEVLAVLAVLFVAVAFALRGRAIHEMLPLLALLAVAFARLVPAFGVINSAWSTMRYRRHAFDVVCRELEELEGQFSSGSAAPSGPDAAALTDKDIVLQDVHFSYPASTIAALNGISLRIPHGQAVGFIGPSGSGKSTLINVILGLLRPTTGTVQVGHYDIHADLAAWQRRLGYVPQDIFLADDTVRRNVAFGLPDEKISETALSAALRGARVDAFLSQLPSGLDTTVGDDGVRLSGGQRQRIGIARALYRDPDVLVMDEATSSLDSETEREVMAAISQLRGQRTVIMIAHRLATVRNCDRLYILEAGRIKDAGSFTELSERYPELALAAAESVRP